MPIRQRQYPERGEDQESVSPMPGDARLEARGTSVTTHGCGRAGAWFPLTGLSG